MKREVRLSVIILFALIMMSSTPALAQEKDSTSEHKQDTAKIFHFNEDAFNYRHVSLLYQSTDTSLAGLQNVTYLRNKLPFTARFANSGLAYRNLEYQEEYSSDFISSRDFFKEYFSTQENAQYFQANTPFANATFSMGRLREQILDVLFTRNVRKRLNIAVQYKLNFSPGVYLQQKSNNTFLIFTSNYSTKDDRYRAIGNYFYNRIRVQENGGLTNDSDFTYNLEPNRQLVPINLNYAENNVKESGFYIRQFYFPGFDWLNKKDSCKPKQPFTGLGQISYSFLFKNQSEVYIDAAADSSYFPSPLIDTAATYDSIHITTIENTIGWSNTEYHAKDNKQWLFLYVGLKHRISKLYARTVDTTFISLIPQFFLKLNSGIGPVFAGDGFYYMNGYQKGDYSLTLKASEYFKTDSLNKGYIGGSLHFMRQSPAWFDKYYSGNFFAWNENLEPVFTNSANLFYHSKKFEAMLGYRQILNYTYYDTFALPQQYNARIDMAYCNVNKDFKWKYWEIDNKVVFQKAFNGDVIRLPEIMTNHSISYSHNFFKNAMATRFGMDISFFSSYYPLAWMPANREFYLQNNYRSENYPYIDLFMNIKIKRARIFIKLDHVNSGLMGHNYFMIPNYPMADRSLKFGISWMFYD